MSGPIGACFFGTSEGLTFRGAGVLRSPSDNLQNALDFRRMKIERGELTWFSFPLKVGSKEARLIGQVGFTTDFRKRDGISAFALIVPDAVLKQSGYAGPVHTIERLYAWFVANCVAAESGLIDFDKAAEVLSRLNLPEGTHDDIGAINPLKLKLPRNWQSFIHMSQLLEVLPMQIDIGDAEGRGFVLRTVDAAKYDNEISSQYLGSWRENQLGPKERDKLVDGLRRSSDARKLAERQLEEARARLDQTLSAAGAMERQRDEVRAALQQEEMARDKLARELQLRVAELEGAKQAVAASTDNADRLTTALKDATHERNHVLSQLNTLSASIKEKEGQLRHLDAALRSARSEGEMAAQKRYEAQLSQLQRDKAALRAGTEEALAKAKEFAAQRDELQYRLDEQRGREPTDQYPRHLNPRRSSGIGQFIAILGVAVGCTAGAYAIGSHHGKAVGEQLAETSATTMARLRSDNEVLRGDVSRRDEQRREDLEKHRRELRASQNASAKTADDYNRLEGAHEALKRSFTTQGEELKQVRSQLARAQDELKKIGSPPVPTPLPPPDDNRPLDPRPGVPDRYQCGLVDNDFEYTKFVKEQCAGRSLPPAGCDTTRLADIITRLNTCPQSATCGEKPVTQNVFKKTNVDLVITTMTCIQAKVPKQ